jgi:hypothetical protein
MKLLDDFAMQCGGNGGDVACPEQIERVAQKAKLLPRGTLKVF